MVPAMSTDAPNERQLRERFDHSCVVDEWYLELRGPSQLTEAQTNELRKAVGRLVRGLVAQANGSLQRSSAWVRFD